MRRPIAFSPDGKHLAAKVSRKSEVVEAREVSSGQVRAVLHPNLPRRNDWFSPQGIRFSPDARILFLEDIGGYTTPSESNAGTAPGSTRAWSFKGRRKASLPDGSRAAIAEFDPGSRWDPVARNNSVVKVFDLPAPQVRVRLVETGVHKATISPNGRIMALPSDRREARESPGVVFLPRLILRALGVWRRGLAVLDPPSVAVHEDQVSRRRNWTACRHDRLLGKASSAGLDDVLARQ